MNPEEQKQLPERSVSRKLVAMAGLAMAMEQMVGGGGTKLRQQMDLRDKKNPHNHPRFETDGFVTYSINQASHDAKYAKYLKKKSK